MNNQEKKLIQQAQQGDISSFEELVKKVDRRVISLVFQMLGNTEDAEDCYQDIFMKVYSHIKKFRFQSDFYTWVYRIAVHCAIDYRKKRKAHLLTSYNELKNQDTEWQEKAPDQEATPEDRMIGEEIKQQIQSVLDSLPMMQRVVFFLRFMQDLKIKDIAEIIDCSEGTVKSYLFRSTEKVKIRLSAYLK